MVSDIQWKESVKSLDRSIRKLFAFKKKLTLISVSQSVCQKIFNASYKQGVFLLLLDVTLIINVWSKYNTVSRCCPDVGSSFRIQLREILSVHITIEGPSQLILLEFNIKFKFQRSRTGRLQKLPFIYVVFYVYRETT